MFLKRTYLFLLFSLFLSFSFIGAQSAKQKELEVQRRGFQPGRHLRHVGANSVDVESRPTLHGLLHYLLPQAIGVEPEAQRLARRLGAPPGRHRRLPAGP